MPPRKVVKPAAVTCIDEECGEISLADSIYCSEHHPALEVKENVPEPTTIDDLVAFIGGCLTVARVDRNWTKVIDLTKLSVDLIMKKGLFGSDPGAAMPKNVENMSDQQLDEAIEAQEKASQI